MISELHVIDYKVLLFNISRAAVCFYLFVFLHSILTCFRITLKRFQGSCFVTLRTLLRTGSDRQHKAAFEQGYIK